MCNCRGWSHLLRHCLFMRVITKHSQCVQSVSSVTELQCTRSGRTAGTLFSATLEYWSTASGSPPTAAPATYVHLQWEESQISHLANNLRCLYINFFHKYHCLHQWFSFHEYFFYLAMVKFCGRPQWRRGRVQASVDACGQGGVKILLKLCGRHKWMSPYCGRHMQQWLQGKRHTVVLQENVFPRRWL